MKFDLPNEFPVVRNIVKAIISSVELPLLPCHELLSHNRSSKSLDALEVPEEFRCGINISVKFRVNYRVSE